jgi:hypothetical protein
VDTFDTAGDIHRRLAVRYLRENPWVGEDGALAATAFEAQQQLAEQDEGDRDFLARFARLYPEWQKHYDAYTAAVAEGREPPMPGRRGEGPRHPSPNPPRPPGPEPGPEIHAPTTPAAPVVEASAYRRADEAEAHGGRISPRHGEAALRYLRQHECSWAEAVAATAGG